MSSKEEEDKVINNNYDADWKIMFDPLCEETVYIYRLIDREGIICYVGQTINLTERVVSHLRKKKDVYRIEYIRVPRGEADSIEGELILRNLPRYNLTVPRGERFMSLDAYSKFDRRFLTHQVRALRISKGFESVGGYYFIDDLKKNGRDLRRAGKKWGRRVTVNTLKKING